MMLKRKSVYIIVSIFIGILYILFASNLGSNRAKKEFYRFDNSEINDLLLDVYIKHHGVGFTIQGSQNEYIFYPYTGELNSYKIFRQFAKKGDRIIKRKHSDTLLLVSNEKTYKYTFRKFNE